jgi:hypothetical protein
MIVYYIMMNVMINGNKNSLLLCILFFILKIQEIMKLIHTK